MFVQQLYTGCLSEAAYYIESNGEAAIVDPLRDIDAYLQLAAERKAQIKYIFETHFHADFVSGHLDLAAATGATIVYGPGTQTRFPVTVASDGQKFALGELQIEVLHTPGHTLESSCYLLRDPQNNPYAVFTGDTLFVGDVGRPDLAQKQNEITMEDLAGLLYDSLRHKLMTLPDAVLVYPAHGAGSSCGKNMGPETYSTIGQQKASNYALQEQTKEDFIKAVTEGLTAPPAYFPINVAMNKEGYEKLDEVLQQGLQALSVAAFKAKMAEGAWVVDTRNANVFAQGFVPGAISIGLEGRFAEWAGALLPFDQFLLLVTEPGKEKESLVRLARVGLDKVVGYLDGGYPAWEAAGENRDMVINVEADELAMDLGFDENLVVVDVRKENEYNNGHLKEALNLPLSDLTDPGSMAHLEERHNLYVHCAGGYRSIIAASLLKRQGIHNLRNVEGGWQAIQALSDKFKIIKEAVALN